MADGNDITKIALPVLAGAAAGAALTYMFTKRTCPGQALAMAAQKQQQQQAAPQQQDGQKGTESNVIYETDKSAYQYMEFHYTPSAKLFEPYNPKMTVQEAFDFPIRVARKFDEFKPKKMGRVLDLGCAVGMSSFELTKSFNEVVGVDLSAGFIRCAQRIAKERVAEYEGPEQGLRGIPRRIALADDINTDKVRFEVGDAMNVDPALGTFDGVLAANLVCRVPDPEKMLRSFARIINKGGILVLVSPYSWWDGATAQDKWIGGTPGSERSEVLVRKILESAGFECVDEKDEPFLIRDHHRRFQLGFSSCTVWRRV